MTPPPKQRITQKLPAPVKKLIGHSIILSSRLRNAWDQRRGNPIIPKEELKLFSLLKDDIDVVFDVGAREDLSFYEIKPDCDYYLFEPNTDFVQTLKNKVTTLPGAHITINPFGLSDVHANDCIYYENSQSFVENPTYKENIDKGRRFSLRRLDDYVKEKNIAYIDFLKIDAEGLDYKVILGGLETIKKKVAYVQFEYWDGVKKFTNILAQNFNLYLMMEPLLLKAIEQHIRPSMTPAQQARDYHQSLIPLDADVIDLIDNKIIPTGNGGNILGISKQRPNSFHKALYQISL